MTKILFVCHGNICRSPMAEYFMKDIVRREGLEKRFEITGEFAGLHVLFRGDEPRGDRKRCVSACAQDAR